MAPSKNFDRLIGSIEADVANLKTDTKEIKEAQTFMGQAQAEIATTLKANTALMLEMKREFKEFVGDTKVKERLSALEYWQTGMKKLEAKTSSRWFQIVMVVFNVLLAGFVGYFVSK